MTIDAYDIVDIIVIENEEFSNITQRQMLKITAILEEEVENGVNSKLELKKLAYKELLRVA